MHSGRIIISAIAITGSILASAHAQTVPQPPSAAERPDQRELIVTAQKRAEPALEVPLSMTARSGEALLDLGLVELNDYLADIPGISINARGNGQSLIAIRGISTGVGAAPAVGFTIDDVPFGGSTLYGSYGGLLHPELDPFDIERVEVLRGPQGTLYGASSMGGLVKFVTRAPSFDGFESVIRLDGSQVENGGSGFGLRGVFNLPLGKSAALRVSGFRRTDPGFINDPFRHLKDVNEKEAWGTRAALRFTPGTRTEITVSALIQAINSDGANIYDLTPGYVPVYGDLLVKRLPGSELARMRYRLLSGTIKQDLDWASLISVTAYTESRYRTIVDVSPVWGPRAAAAFNIPVPGAVGQYAFATDKFSQELRLTSPGDTRFEWLTGAFFTIEDSRGRQRFQPVDPATGAPLNTPELFDDTYPSTFKEIAAFGNAGFDITPRLSVQGGVRYSRNWQSFVEIVRGALGLPDAGAVKSRDDSFTMLLTGQYRFTDNVMVYARVATGYRPGGPNTRAGGVDTPRTFGADNTINYELGMKGSFAGGAAEIEAAAFRIDWDKIQLLQRTPLNAGYFANGGTARSEGAELNLTMRPAFWAAMGFNATYLDARLTQDAPPTIFALDGERMPYSPKWAGGAFMRLEDALGPWALSFQANYRWEGARGGEFARRANLPRYTLPAYDLVDIQTGIARGGWKAQLFIRNLTDERAITSINPRNGSDAASILMAGVTQPRTVGLALSRIF